MLQSALCVCVCVCVTKARIYKLREKTSEFAGIMSCGEQKQKK